MTLVWGVVLAMLGTLRWGPMLEAGLTIASITLGSLLGLFLLAFLLRRATASGVLTGMFVGFAAILWIHFYTPLLWDVVRSRRCRNHVPDWRNRKSCEQLRVAPQKAK